VVRVGAHLPIKKPDEKKWKSLKDNYSRLAFNFVVRHLLAGSSICDVLGVHSSDWRRYVQLQPNTIMESLQSMPLFEYCIYDNCSGMKLLEATYVYSTRRLSRTIAEI
jgi:hypothetical protein